MEIDEVLPNGDEVESESRALGLLLVFSKCMR